MHATSPTVSAPAVSRAPSAPGRSPKNAALSLDLSNLPPLQQPTPPSNTLLITGLDDPAIFRPDNLQTIRALVSNTAPIHTWAPLKSFRRILVSFADAADAVAVRAVWDGAPVLGARCRVYFGQPAAAAAAVKDTHLALPDAGKLFFISPPPSPPHDWAQRLEDAPNKHVHAEDLADALARLHHHAAPGLDAAMDLSPVSPVEGKSAGPNPPSAGRSRSSTLIFRPDAQSAAPNLPCVMVDDMTDEDGTAAEAGPTPMDLEPRPIMAHTTRPPLELAHDA